MAAKKQVSRTKYVIDQEGLSKVLALLVQRDHQETIMFAKKIFYAQKGNEVRPLTYEEVQKLISKGFK